MSTSSLRFLETTSSAEEESTEEEDTEEEDIPPPPDWPPPTAMPPPLFGVDDSIVQWWAPWMKLYERPVVSPASSLQPRWFRAKIVAYAGVHAVMYAGVHWPPDHLYDLKTQSESSDRVPERFIRLAKGKQEQDAQLGTCVSEEIPAFWIEVIADAV